jgi:hypothetical protein
MIATLLGAMLSGAACALLGVYFVIAFARATR